MTALRPTADEIAAARRLLGVGVRPTRDEILSSWKRRLRETHPDMATDEGRSRAEDASKELNAAKDTLLRALASGWVPYAPMPPPPNAGSASRPNGSAVRPGGPVTSPGGGPRPVSRQTASVRTASGYGTPAPPIPVPKVLRHPMLIGFGFLTLFLVILILVGLATGGGEVRGQSRIDPTSSTAPPESSADGEIPTAGPVPTTPHSETLDDASGMPATSAGPSVARPSAGGATRPVPGGVEAVPLPADTPETAVKLLLFAGTSSSAEVLNGILDRNVRGDALGRILDDMHNAGARGTISYGLTAVMCTPVVGLDRTTCTAGNIFARPLDVRRTEDGWRIAGYTA